MGPFRGRVRETAVNVALAAGVVTLLGGGAELIARLTEGQAAPPPADYITDWQAWDGDFYTVKSTAVGWPPWEDYNTEGLRDHEHTLRKRAGVQRVACLGDSVTMGWSIRPREAWPQMLEELAASRGRDLDVMNVALGGWSTRQELTAYRRIARRYRPDLVLLGVCLNDIPEMQNNLSRPSPWLAQLHRHSALVRRVVGAQRREIGDVEELFTLPDSPKVRQGWERLFAEVRELRDEVEADRGRFAVLVFPFRFQVTPQAPPPVAQRTMADFCRREGIPLLDPLPALAHLGTSAFLDYDHFNPAGSRLVAEQVLESPLLRSDAEAELASGVAPSPAEPPRLAGEKRDQLRLLEALRDPSDVRRAAAARAISLLGEAAAPLVPGLVAALDDQSPVVRAAAAWALGNVGSEAAPAASRLRRALLTDPDPFVRAGAAHSLGNLGARGSAQPLIERLDDPDERVRRYAAESIAAIGLQADSVPSLLQLLRRTSSAGRGLVAQALGRLGADSREAVPDLIAAALDARPDVRWRAIWALGQIGPPAKPAVTVLRAALADPDLRWRAAEALGGIGPDAVQAVPDLLALLGDPSSNVRWRAATALGKIRAPRAASGLAKAVADPAENVRLAATVALIEVDADQALAEPAFLAALHDTDRRVRLQALRGLGRQYSPSPAARRALEAAAKDPDPDVRARAAISLSKRWQQQTRR